MPYNGHRNYDYWNVALWLANDEGLYRLALDCKRRHKTATAAAEEMIELLPKKTPDGVRYTIPTLRAAIADLD